MGISRLISTPCPKCNRAVPFLPDSFAAVCLCGNRVIVKGLDGTRYKPPVVHQVSPEQRLTMLRRLWRQIHTYPYVVCNWSECAAKRWFDKWTARIPNKDCHCQDHWNETIAKHPIDFTSREAFFQSSVRNHNLVNERLGKPILSLGQAKEAHCLFDNGRYVRKDDRPSIGFLASVYNRFGGTETWHKAIVPALAERFNVTAVAVENIELFYPDLDVPMVSGWDACAAVIAQSDIVISWGVDVSHMLSPGVKIVAVDHGDLHNSNFYSRFIEQNTDLFCAAACVNADVAHHLRSKAKFPVLHIPNAVPASRIEVTEDVRLSNPWLDGKKVVLWSARTSAEKRPNLAVEAALHLPDDWVLVMIGGHPDVEPPANVKCLGPLPSQANWLAVADVFLSTTSAEGFGLSMAEAMLAGVPVVATPFGIGERSELVTQLAANPSAAEIAQAIVSADRTKAEIAREFVIENHSEGITHKWISLIQSLA